MLAAGFDPSTFRLTSSGPADLPQLGTRSWYSGGPSSSCYSHLFSHRQTPPVPVRTSSGVAVHLLDLEAPATESGLMYRVCLNDSRE